ncbi:MAG: helix-turn-helix domain-containing protein [Ktedonobacterales bacterium]
MGERLRQHISRQTGWRWLRRLGARWRKPRPRHISADPAAQHAFKDRLRPLLQQVAAAFPKAQVELWTMEIVCTQMTKTDLCASGRGRDDIADLHLVIQNNGTVY